MIPVFSYLHLEDSMGLKPGSPSSFSIFLTYPKDLKA